jgi:hypothetical protein
MRTAAAAQPPSFGGKVPSIAVLALSIVVAGICTALPVQASPSRRPGVPNAEEDSRIVAKLDIGRGASLRVPQVQLDRRGLQHIVYGTWKEERVPRREVDGRVTQRRTVVLHGGGGHTTEGTGDEAPGFRYWREQDGMAIVRPDLINDGKWRALMFRSLLGGEKQLVTDATYHQVRVPGTHLEIVTWPREALSQSTLAEARAAARQDDEQRGGPDKLHLYRKALLPRGLGRPEREPDLIDQT